MNDSTPVFLDANVLVYYLDETAVQHDEVVGRLQGMVDQGTELYTSHHVLEEVFFIVAKISGDKASVLTAVQEVTGIPGLMLAEPAAEFEFAKRYVELFQKLNVGINDTLLLQLILDAGISRLFTFDTKMLKQAQALGIQAAA